jgi:hypothetical protein
MVVQRQLYIDDFHVTSYPYHANTTGMYSTAPKKNSTALKLQPPYPTNLKKEKGFFSFFRFKTTSLRPRHVGRMSGALCDLREI